MRTGSQRVIERNGHYVVHTLLPNLRTDARNHEVEHTTPSGLTTLYYRRTWIAARLLIRRLTKGSTR